MSTPEEPTSLVRLISELAGRRGRRRRTDTRDDLLELFAKHRKTVKAEWP
jgi:hypothetical protein